MTMYENYREMKKHGKAEFPFDIYSCQIPEVIPEVLPHWHDEFELIYLEKGSASISVAGENKELSSPALVLVFPGQLHAIRSTSKESVKYRNILFKTDLMYSKTEEMTDWAYLRPLFEGKYKVPSFLDSSFPDLSVLVEPILACGDRGDKLTEAYPLLVKSQLYLFCYRLLRLFPDKEEEHDRMKAQNRIKPVVTFIMEHYCENISVGDAARVAGYSKAHFMRIFRDSMGVSFVAYLRNFRLSKAEERIRTCDDSILTIAQEVGFSNFSYFIRNFKERYHLSPLQYRKLRRNSDKRV